MNPNADTPSGLDPELLAAYVDGELEGRDECAPLRQCVEAWLAESPLARAQFAEQRRLAKLWQLTSPADPSPRAWRDLSERLHHDCQELAKREGVSTRRRWLLTGAVAAAAACFLTALVLWPRDQVRLQPLVDFSALNLPLENMEVLVVAQAHEVVILNVEGADTSTVVVGELPVNGPLEMATRDEISVTHMQPCQRDNMVPCVRGQRPMIWAFLDSEREGD